MIFFHHFNTDRYSKNFVIVVLIVVMTPNHFLYRLK